MMIYLKNVDVQRIACTGIYGLADMVSRQCLMTAVKSPLTAVSHLIDVLNCTIACGFACRKTMTQLS